MKHHGALCHECNTIIFSRAQHDFRRCECGKIFIDGGFDYGRHGYTPGFGFSTIFLTLNVSKDTLYQDWNCLKDQYGSFQKDCPHPGVEEWSYEDCDR